MVREETLDPEDWEEMKNLARKMAEDMITYQQNIRKIPTFNIPNKEIIEKFKEPLPPEPLGPVETYKEFNEKIVKNMGANVQHPGFWFTVVGTGTPFGALADMWMSGLNGISSENRHLSTHVEYQVLSWLKEMLKYPKQASGVLVSGGSMANLIGLIVARNTKAGYDIKEEGSLGDLTFYGSTEMHYSIQRGLESIGVGNKNLRRIPTDEKFHINLEALQNKVREDREAGLKPICVIGCAGTTNTGAFDDLEGLANFCVEEDLWLHVDGAFGAWAALSKKYCHLVKGMERADSLAFDLHKWMYMPYGIGCTLVRNDDAHFKAFAHQADYFTHDRSLSDYTIELSRPFRSLKAWMSLKENGVNKYARLIEQNIEQVMYFAKKVLDCPLFELLAPVESNVVCFRFKKENIGEEQLRLLNMGIIEKFLANPPKFALGYTTVNGTFGLRICITNHRTTREDLDNAFEWLLSTGKGIKVM